ncbi:Sec23/Sec24 zinc finger-containing protein [archaeon]|nr:MAG: Sec23/Sec24 zinc finger-containing protein [archaeon]
MILALHIYGRYRQVDYRTKVWTCVFCTARNHFPPHYAENISETSLPAELIPQFSTVEYELPQFTAPPIAGPPVFVFLIDVVVDEDELVQLRDALLQTLNLLPEDSLVGLITFGTLINVYELGFAECSKAFALRGEKEYSAQKIQEMLCIAPARPSGTAAANMPFSNRQSAVGRFLLPVSDCMFTLETILEDLTRDPWPSPQDERAARCTGNALNVAVSLLEIAAPRQGSRVLLFTSGPCTVGAGTTASKSRKVPMRSHGDIAKGQASLCKPAVDYYRALSERCINSYVVCDLFACSLDQNGAMEMKILMHRTGGLTVLADKYGQSMFRESLRRIFERPASQDPNSSSGSVGALQMGFGASIEVLCSRDVKLAGCIGPCASLKKSAPSVSENEVGIG